MICNKCGYESIGGGRLCSKCGALMDQHEVDVENIDISGMALAEEEKPETTSSKGIGGIVIIVAVLIVLGVVAAIFVPSYLSQAKAGLILEGITAARGGVETYVKEHRVWPVSESDIGSGVAGYAESELTIKIDRGVIKLSFPEEPGKTVTISPSMKKGRIIWRCDNGGIGPEYLPVGCFK